MVHFIILCENTSNIYLFFLLILQQPRSTLFPYTTLFRSAQKTDARQINKNLLLSEGAVVDTKPQLEIFADDVKCAHGAAVGELDEDALFYLRSRGLGREAARSLLTYAFASEMVDLIPLAPSRTRVRELVTSRLPDRESLREVA